MLFKGKANFIDFFSYRKSFLGDIFTSDVDFFALWFDIIHND